MSKGGFVVEFEYVSDKELEDVAGGFNYTEGCHIEGIKFSQEEFDQLREANIIGEDGNLYYRDIKKAFKHLREKGYQEKSIRFAVGMAANAWHESERKRWDENKPVKFEII